MCETKQNKQTNKPGARNLFCTGVGDGRNGRRKTKRWHTDKRTTLQSAPSVVAYSKERKMVRYAVIIRK